MEILVPVFFDVQLHLKLYHWQTLSYGHHRAVDAGLDDLREKMDEFVEVYLGGMRDPAKRFRVTAPHTTLTLKNMSERSVVALLRRFATFLDKRLPSLLSSPPSSSPDLLNLRDEMLALVRRLLYLLSLR